MLAFSDYTGPDLCCPTVFIFYLLFFLLILGRSVDWGSLTDSFRARVNIGPSHHNIFIFWTPPALQNSKMNLVIGNVKYRGRDLQFLTESPFFSESVQDYSKNQNDDLSCTTFLDSVKLSMQIFQLQFHYTAAQCIVFGPVCGFVTAGGRAGGVRTLLQPARAEFASLWALFSFHLLYIFHFHFQFQFWAFFHF